MVVSVMATAEKLYRKFGPKLIDAVVRVQHDQNNMLRETLGLPTVTLQQVVNAIAEELETIPNYDWMNEVI
jgi:hypothetical protein